MVVVKKKPGESDDKLIARFRKKVINDRIIEEIRDRDRFVSPSERRKAQKYRIKHNIELQKKRNS